MRCLKLFRGGFREVFGGQIEENYPEQIRTKSENPIRSYKMIFNIAFSSQFHEHGVLKFEHRTFLVLELSF